MFESNKDGMSAEQLDMLFKELGALRDKMSVSAVFQGKVEGSVRVLHFFITLATGAMIAFSVIAYNASVTLDGLKNKMTDLDPLTIKLMVRDIADLKTWKDSLQPSQLPTKKR